MNQELYIDEELVDLNPDSRIVLRKDFLDLQNPDARISDSSLRMNLPKSKRNNIIFTHQDAENVKNRFVRLEDYPARLLVDGVLVLDGVFRVLEIGETSYTGVLFQGNLSWSRSLQGKSIRDLKNDDGITPWSTPFVGLETGNTPYSLKWYVENDSYLDFDVTFPLVSYGTFFSRSIFGGKIDEVHGDSLSLDNFPPSVYDLKIIKRIFQNVGWSVDSSLFSDSEAQNVYMPFTASDKVEWNFDRVLGGSSSGGTQSILGTSTTFPAVQFDYRRQIIFSGALTNWKWSDFSLLKTPNRYVTYNDNFQFFNSTGYNGPFSSNCYFTPVTAEYSFDLTLKNWAFNCSGVGYQVAGIYYTPFAAAVGSGTTVDWLRAGIVVYIDTPNESFRGDVFDNLNRYVWNFYYDPTTPTIEIDHPNILAAYVPTISGYTAFFQPYDNDADIVVTGTTRSISYGGLAGGNIQNYFLRASSPDLKFEFRNVTIPQGYVIRIATFGGGSSPGSVRDPNTLSGLFTPLSSEAQYAFSASSIDLRFLGNDRNDDVDLDIAKNLPQISQLDYIRSFIDRYSLFISTDLKNKKVQFEPYDSFYLPNDFALDFDEKLDGRNFRPKASPVNLPKFVNLKWSNDTNDALLAPDLGYGSVSLKNNNVYTDGTKDISILFSGSKTRPFRFVPSDGGRFHLSYPAFELPSIANSDSYNFADLGQVEMKYTFAPRLLKKTGQLVTNRTGGTWNYPVMNTSMPIILSTWKDERPGKLSLAFDGPENGLYNDYYERYLNEISDSYYIELEGKLSPADYAKLMPNVPVKYDNQIWIVKSINNYSPLTGGDCVISLVRKFTN